MLSRAVQVCRLAEPAIKSTTQKSSRVLINSSSSFKRNYSDKPVKPSSGNRSKDLHVKLNNGKKSQSLERMLDQEEIEEETDRDLIRTLAKLEDEKIELAKNRLTGKGPVNEYEKHVLKLSESQNKLIEEKLKIISELSEDVDLNDLKRIFESKVQNKISFKLTPITESYSTVAKFDQDVPKAILSVEKQPESDFVQPIITFLSKFPEKSEEGALFIEYLDSIDPTFTTLIKHGAKEQATPESLAPIYAHIETGLISKITTAQLDEITSFLVSKEIPIMLPAINTPTTKEESKFSLVKQIEALAKEDKSKLTPEVIEMNKYFDYAIQAMNELQEDIKNNTLEPITKSQRKTLLSLSDFKPTSKQLEQQERTLSKVLPNYQDDVLKLCVNLIMKDGEKQRARKYMNRALYLIYLEARENPVEILKQALDLAAPLVITKTVKTGFAKNYTVPVPLTPRQRNRMAFLWILDSSNSRASNDFPVRLAEEILNVVGGKSKIMDKRVLNHKLAIANRSYLRL